MTETSRPTAGGERHPQGVRLLLLVAGAALLTVSLANCGQAFFFPLELEFKEGTSWLHVLTMQAGISIYDHQQVAYINMNHGPLNPVLKYLLATALPFLRPAMVTRFFVLLLPVGLFAGMAGACPAKKGSALLWAAGLHLFLLGIQPPHFLVGRSDPTALFLLAVLLGTAAGPMSNVAATARRRFGWIVVCGVLGAMVFLTNWRLGPAVGLVGAAFALEYQAAHGRSALRAYFGSMLLGGGGFSLLLFFALFHGDGVLYYRHFFGFFSTESGWGALRGESFELFPRALLAPHGLIHGLALAGLALGPVFPTRQVPRRVQLLGWLPLLGLLWMASCAAYFLNRSGGGIWYFGAFYVLLAFHLARAIDWARVGSPWLRGLFFAGLFLGLPWQTTWQQARQLTESFAPAYAFLQTTKLLAAGERIHSEDYYFFKDRYEGEAIDVGDEVAKIGATGYMGEPFTGTANRYFAKLRSDPPRFVITGGSISPVLKELLAKAYQPILRVPPAQWLYAGPAQTFYQLKPVPPPATP